MGFFDKLKQGLTKTRQTLTDKIEQLISGSAKIDEDFLEEMEAILISADVGVATTDQLMKRLRQGIKTKEVEGPEQVKPFLAKAVSELLIKDNQAFALADSKPTVVLVVGVNGVGKTTTIAKLGHYYQEQGKKILFAAGDTFRAAAAEQLDIWAKRVGASLVRHEEGADPAAVAFDAIQAAKARGTDVVFIDTAGRLHNKANLMEELKKIYRVIQRELPGAPHATLLVLDATTGQNALQQAKIFGEVSHVTGVVLTKLDGTAKGGVVVAMAAELGTPVQWVGVGEGMDDLRPFNPEEFAQALFPDK